MAVFGDLATLLRQTADANRTVLLEEVAEQESSKRKIGQFKAYWKGFTDSGDGKVLHRGKIYTARVLGTTSIQLNGIVNFTVTENDFFVDW
jgi:hypothetical protein